MKAETQQQLTSTEPGVIGCRLLKGKVIHAAIEITMKNPYSGNEFQAFKPVCGKRAPRHSLTYGYSGTREAINCAKCLARISEQS